MAIHPAIIAGRALTTKPWREVGAVTQAADAETTAMSPERALDMIIELRALGHITHRLATLSGTCSVALLWASSWSGSAARTTSPSMLIGAATSVLAVVLAIIALGLELLTRVRIERAPRLTTIEEHRQRIEAESAAFRENLPTTDPRHRPRPAQRRGKLGRPRSAG